MKMRSSPTLQSVNRHVGSLPETFDELQVPTTLSAHCIQLLNTLSASYYIDHSYYIDQSYYIERLLHQTADCIERPVW